MGCLSVFDVSGIQNYLFRTNKLKESIGASHVVTRVLREMLPAAVQKKCTNYKITWQDQTHFEIVKKSLEAEIIYVGGGNAMVAFDRCETAEKVTRSLSLRLIDAAPGLEMAVAHHETPFENFIADRHALFQKKLMNCKQSAIRTMGLQGLAITRRCPQNGLPTTAQVAGEWYSAEVVAKRNAAEKDVLAAEFLPHDIQFTFPKELDDLGQIEGENHIAVIHVDGNDMGHRLNQLIQNQKDYTSAVKTMRDFSIEVSKAYKASFATVVEKLRSNTMQQAQTYYTAGKVRLKISDGQKACLPVRPLLFDGDDIVLVTDGRLGLSLAEALLHELSKKSIVVNGNRFPLSASAGVAVVKSHFPFYRACRLAEELTLSAKAKAKTLRSNPAADAGSWLDFQVIYSGVTTDLRTLRNRHYMVAGRPSPVALAMGERRCARYNLCARPWRVTPVDGQIDEEFSLLKKVYDEFCQWPRSRLKDLRTDLASAPSVSHNRIFQHLSRGFRLPDANTKGRIILADGFGSDHITPYFDALELLDFFLPLQ